MGMFSPMVMGMGMRSSSRWARRRGLHSVASRQGGPVAPGWPAGARWGDNVAGGAGRRCSGPARVAWRGYRGLAGLCHASVTAMELRDCAQIMLGGVHGAMDDVNATAIDSQLRELQFG